MKSRILTTLCLALALLAFGCDKQHADDHAHDDEAKAEAPADKIEAEGPAEQKPAEDKEAEAAEDKKLEKVEVAKAGTKFDPAVQAEQLPADAWYCDMGTVHFAAMDKPEGGKCPECSMALKQHDPEKLAAQKQKAVEPHEHAEDHGDHAHEGDDHGHEGDDHGHAHEEEGHGHAH